jgi:hypothetical protein
LLWLGAALLLIRLRAGWSAGSGRIAGGRATTPAGFLLAARAAAGPAINRGLLVLALLAFSVNPGIFAPPRATGPRRRPLTLAPTSSRAPAGAITRGWLLQTLARLPGAAGAFGCRPHPCVRRPDLQDTFGIDPSTSPRDDAGDSYWRWRGGCPAGCDDPDGILVSGDDQDYSLRRGDLLRLRILDHRSGRFRVAPFHVVGIVQEFPSAPKDSFMVANLRYLQRVTHDPGPNVLFVRARSDPVALAHAVAHATHTLGVSVRDIRQQMVQTGSSITTVDLRWDRPESRRRSYSSLSFATMPLFVAVGWPNGVTSSQRWPHPAPLRKSRGFSLGAMPRPCLPPHSFWRRYWLAVGRDAGRDVAARARPARPSRCPLGFFAGLAATIGGPLSPQRAVALVDPQAPTRRHPGE